jgi:hypothetical protein
VSDTDYAAATVAVHEAMLKAYPGHIGRRVAALGVDPADVAAAVEVGRRWLEVAYREQRGLPPGVQRRSPLELLQAACAFPTERLEDLGLEPVERDEVAAAALPGDRYGLAPVSSQELGDDVWKVHVAWGVARAAEVAGVVPRASSASTRTSIGVAVVTANLMDRTRIVDTATDAGLSTVVWRNPGAVERGLVGHEPAVAFVDLEHAAADAVVRLLGEAGVRTVAYGPHVDDVAMARARSLGATDVVPRSKLFTRLRDWLPKPT